MDETKREVKKGDRVKSPQHGEGTVLWTPADETDCFLELICVRFDNPSSRLHDGVFDSDEDQGDPENAFHCWWYIESDFDTGELAYVE